MLEGKVAEVEVTDKISELEERSIEFTHSEQRKKNRLGKKKKTTQRLTEILAITKNLAFVLVGFLMTQLVKNLPAMQETWV